MKVIPNNFKKLRNTVWKVTNKESRLWYDPHHVIRINGIKNGRLLKYSYHLSPDHHPPGCNRRRKSEKICRHRSTTLNLRYKICKPLFSKPVAEITRDAEYLRGN